MTKVSEKRIYTTLMGCAYGDAFGMPSEGMSLNAIYTILPNGIREFLPSINYDISQRHFAAGSITDDTLHTFLLIDVLYHHPKDFNSHIYIEELAKWYKQCPIADQVIGPSTLKAIEARYANMENTAARFAVSNGAIMKISPIGLIVEEKADILDYVCRVNMPTHASNVCLSSACVVAYLISKFSRKQANLLNLEQITYEMLTYCENVGFDMPAASLKIRIQMALQIARQHKSEYVFLSELSNQIGTSIACTETLPCVLAIIAYAQGNLKQVAELCASIGGDTDTIGAIACSICGALGYVPTYEEINILESVNHFHMEDYVKKVNSVIQSLFPEE